MGDAPDNHELARQAEYESALDRLRADMAAHREDMARHDAASAERDATVRWWQTAILIAAIAALITFAPDLRRLVAGP